MIGSYARREWMAQSVGGIHIVYNRPVKNTSHKVKNR